MSAAAHEAGAATAGGSETRRPLTVPIPEVDFSALGAEEVAAMRAAAAEIRECYRVLAKADLNVVGELLRGHEVFYEDDHYPTGDVFDRETGAQYYYHAHRGVEREHGHFHTFMRRKGMPADLRTRVPPGWTSGPQGDESLAHLVGISMDAWGFPTALFATNRWVTGETWYFAPDVERMLPRFAMDHAWPSWPVNRWLTALLRLFRPQVTVLLRHRDATVSAFAEAFPDRDPLEHRDLEVTGWLPLSVEQQIATLDLHFPARR